MLWGIRDARLDQSDLGRNSERQVLSGVASNEPHRTSIVLNVRKYLPSQTLELGTLVLHLRLQMR